MVTNFGDHWKDGQNTYYTPSMLRKGLKSNQLSNNTKTYFIKRNSDKEFEKCWLGSVTNITNDQKNGKDIIRFRVVIEAETACPLKYRNLTEGWYSYNDDVSNVNLNKSELTNINEPLFFNNLRGGSTWEEFEDYTYLLLRLIGIHTIHQYDKSNQRGKADGFFKIGNMAVLYDCTLENIFEENKNVQVENYCGQLSKDRIKVDSSEYSLKDCNKTVWIITKNSKSRLVKKIDDIEVKEVSIIELINIYNKRLEDQNVNEKQLIKLMEEL